MRFSDYLEARAYAQEKANRLGLPVAIRKTREYGREGFNVTLWSIMDAATERVDPEVRVSTLTQT